MSTYPHTSCNMCSKCQATMNLIGASKPCVICFMKIACKTKNCPNIVDGEDGFCKFCCLTMKLDDSWKVITMYKNDINDLKLIIKCYEDEENERKQKSEHETFSLNHKDFDCNECSKTFMIRDDSQLNICFPCKVMLCDECVKDHE